MYLLVDSSIAPQRIDLDYAVWLHRHKVPFALVFTKVRAVGPVRHCWGWEAR